MPKPKKWHAIKKNRNYFLRFLKVKSCKIGELVNQVNRKTKDIQMQASKERLKTNKIVKMASSNQQLYKRRAKHYLCMDQRTAREISRAYGDKFLAVCGRAGIKNFQQAKELYAKHSIITLKSNIKG